MQPAPQPLPQRQAAKAATSASSSSGNSSAAKSQSGSSGIGGIAMALAIGGGIIYGAYSLLAGSAVLSSEAISAAQRESRRAAWNAATANGIQMLPIPPAERAEAIAGLPIPEADKEKFSLYSGLGHFNIGYIVVYDDAAEDGDVIEINGLGVKISAPLSHARTRIAVPYKTGTPIEIKGVVDGGGGITSGIRVGQGDLYTPVLDTGEVLTVIAR